MDQNRTDPWCMGTQWA